MTPPYGTPNLPTVATWRLPQCAQHSRNKTPKSSPNGEVPRAERDESPGITGGHNNHPAMKIFEKGTLHKIAGARHGGAAVPNSYVRNVP